MPKFGTRLIVAAITFLLGTAAATLFLLKDREPPRDAAVTPTAHRTQALRLVIPDARWEPSFFRSLEQYTKPVGLPSLRTIELPEGDLEVRFWYGTPPDMMAGVVLRRSGGQWSATHFHGRYRRGQYPLEQAPLTAPESGWEALWERLVNAGILTLPDASEIQCHGSALDGIGYVVEVNAANTYRTYHYSNPQLAECNEAKQMVAISKMIADEFDLSAPQ